MSTADAPWPAPGKINRFLHILGRRADGYHRLQTLFQFLDYGDQLRFEPRRDGCLRRHGGIDGLPEAHDLALRAAQALQGATGTGAGADIHLDKRLPVGGGLGGGSSDAATTLVALNRIWRTGLDCAALQRLGLTLGADVPVFVAAVAAFAEGVGERLTPRDADQPWLLVIDPGVAVPTAAMYADPRLRRDCPPLRPDALAAGGLDPDACANVFEPLVLADHAAVAAAYDWLSARAPARLSGSGACLYGRFQRRESAAAALGELPAPWRGFVSRALNRSPLLARLARSRD